MRRTLLTFAWIGTLCCHLVLPPLPPTADARTLNDNPPAALPAIQMEWGGYARVIGTVAEVDDDSAFGQISDGPYVDGQAEWRLKNRSNLGSHLWLETHYELVASGGDTRQTSQALLAEQPGLKPSAIFINLPQDDDSRLMDLTHVFSQTDDMLVYQRLDRLNLTWTPEWGTVRVGRQALTWGDGMVFNPMDLFNPFAPAAVERDYKTGDDMALLQLPLGQSDMQLLYLPRRDPLTGDVESDMSSFAANFHTFANTVELSAMGALHFDDMIGGLGASATLGGAVWRFNVVYTHLAEELQENDFVQLVANLDYAWMWGDRNVYGLLEIYYNGLGYREDYQRALSNDALMDRILRGEMFTLGRLYLAGLMQVELHPLVQLQMTAIVNLADPSGLLQPQVSWDVLSDLQLIIGAQWHWGRQGTEYGGFEVETDGYAFKMVPGNQAYLWLTYYF